MWLTISKGTTSILHNRCLICIFLFNYLQCLPTSEMIRINNTQYPHFLEQADALRRSGTLCDVIISVKSHTFKAHRLVLACASRRLAQQLSKDDIDSPSCCTLEHFSPHTFQQILDFTYNHTLEVPEEDLCLLLRAAQLLDMQLLADQCRKQLDTLNQRDRGDDRKEDIESENEEENNHALEKDSKKKELAHDNKIQGNYSTEEKVNKTIVAENHSTYVCAENHNNSSCPRQKPRLSPIPTTPDSRHISVITRPVTSCSSVLPACTFPTNKWTSVSALRKIAENYSNLFPLPPINQSSVAYPFSLSTAHVLPLLSPHFQNQVHSSVMGYPGFYPYHTQNRCTAAAGMGSIIKQGLLRRKRIRRASNGGVQDGHRWVISRLRFHFFPKKHLPNFPITYSFRAQLSSQLLLCKSALLESLLSG